jgi:hypothetical protein
VQAVPQVPQFELSVWRFTQEAPHFVVPPVQLVVQLPAEQTSPEPHFLPHVPQFAGSVCMFAH